MNFPFGDSRLPDNFWSKINVDEATDCWRWTAAKQKNGYAKFAVKRKPMLAHRIALLTALGLDSSPLMVDHTCHVVDCVNPSHLRLVTPAQNMENRQGPQSNNTSGIRGVTWDKRWRKWVAQANQGGVSHKFGAYDNLADAERAAIAGRKSLFTHNDVDLLAA